MPSFDIPTTGVPSSPRTTQLAKGNGIPRRASFGLKSLKSPAVTRRLTRKAQRFLASCVLHPPLTSLSVIRHTLMVVPVLSLPFFTCAATINACKDYFMFPIPTTTVYGIAPEEPASFIHTAVIRLTHVLVRSCEPHPAFVSPAQTYHVSQAIVMFISNSNFPDHAAQRCGGAVWAAVVSPTSHTQAFFVCDLVECTVALCLSWASLSRSLYLRSSNRIIYLLSCFRCRVLSTEY